MQLVNRLQRLQRLAAISADAVSALRQTVTGHIVLGSRDAPSQHDGSCVGVWTGSAVTSFITRDASGTGMPGPSINPLKCATHICRLAVAQWMHADLEALKFANRARSLSHAAIAGQQQHICAVRQHPGLTIGSACLPQVTAAMQHRLLQVQLRAEQQRAAHGHVAATKLDTGSLATSQPIGAPSDHEAVTVDTASAEPQQPAGKQASAGAHQSPAQGSAEAIAGPHAASAVSAEGSAKAADSNSAAGTPPVGSSAPEPALNSWWDDQGCFEYHAPLSTTVRRLKVGAWRRLSRRHCVLDARGSGCGSSFVYWSCII